MNAKTIIAIKVSVLVICIALSSHASMIVTGPISANAVSVTGSVTVSSITVSTMTITNYLNLQAPTNLSGRIAQIAFSSTTQTTTTTSASFVPVDNLIATIVLSSATNYVLISLSGDLYDGTIVPYPYITIYRDLSNLGDTTYGLSTAYSYVDPLTVTILDSPGDTNSHTYQAYIRAQNSMGAAYFPYKSTAYLLLEEITQ